MPAPASPTRSSPGRGRVDPHWPSRPPEGSLSPSGTEGRGTPLLILRPRETPSASGPQREAHSLSLVPGDTEGTPNFLCYLLESLLVPPDPWSIPRPSRTQPGLGRVEAPPLRVRVRSFGTEGTRAPGAGCGRCRGRLPGPPPTFLFFLSSQGTFAQLVAQNALLTDGPLRWYSDPGLAGVSLAAGLSYDEDTQELVVAEAGVYYVFLQVELQRVVAGAASGSVSLALHLQPLSSGAAALTLTVDLPPQPTPNSAFGFRGRLLHLGAGQRLSAHLRAEAGTHFAWQLAQGATVLGLFRVTTQVPAGRPSPRPT
ncbi:PREDICTED: tumor necrosis factor ligand superfamily member 9 [Galeopterus variegatus]|uniref:Tumor necrosis factor ligand superfamily member 9 n=1 Tax=Galeopterus variegatus TaxID=482537 RepID=A0ABM0R0B8_GALVR|nr:PREDICTED: tumor necrosis factor ligand superfamily member 9 [Galeopterus variegatus]